MRNILIVMFAVTVSFVNCVHGVEVEGRLDEDKDASIEDEMFSREVTYAAETTELSAKNTRQVLSGDLITLYETEWQFIYNFLPSETLEEKYKSSSSPPHPDD